jgi:hypothetical protein
MSSGCYLVPTGREFRTHSAPDIVLTTTSGEQSHPEVFDGSTVSQMSISADNLFTTSWSSKVYVYCTDSQPESRCRSRSFDARLDCSSDAQCDAPDPCAIELRELESKFTQEDISNEMLVFVTALLLLTSLCLIAMHLLAW